MLSGFFVALGMMIDQEAIKEYQKKLCNVVDRVRGSTTATFNWGDVNNDPTAKPIALNAEVKVAQHFDDFDKRAKWIINVINGHLTPRPMQACSTQQSSQAKLSY